jgi:hypothetical protein
MPSTLVSRLPLRCATGCFASVVVEVGDGQPAGGGLRQVAVRPASERDGVAHGIVGVGEGGAVVVGGGLQAVQVIVAVGDAARDRAFERRGIPVTQRQLDGRGQDVDYPCILCG